jgi:hypothetical protein
MRILRFRDDCHLTTSTIPEGNQVLQSLQGQLSTINPNNISWHAPKLLVPVLS